ncbi:MAG: ABC transporter substrate-binding protein [Anaerolineales bacterium]|nr:ABC transporter substrate-binding protein [Anaerolineales bacterium]
MNNRFTSRFLVPIALLIILLSGCSSAEDLPPAPTIPASASETPLAAAYGSLVSIDGLGRQVTLDAPAQRVVSLAASNTEILFAIGAGGQIVGRDDTSDFPEAALAIESIGSVFGDLNTEAILALEPDLVLAAGTNSPEQVELLEALDLTVYYLGNPIDFEGLYANLAAVGDLVGREEEAALLIHSLRSRVDAVQSRVVNFEPVSVYYEVDATDVTAPYTVGTGTFQNLLITLAGGINIAGDLELWAPISQEELLAREPDVMLFGTSIWVPTTPESVEERPGWSAMTAVAEGRIFPIDSNWVDRPGPRLVDALEAIAAILHPEL